MEVCDFSYLSTPTASNGSCTMVLAPSPSDLCMCLRQLRWKFSSQSIMRHPSKLSLRLISV